MRLEKDIGLKTITRQMIKKNLKKQTEILKLKSTITKMKNSLENLKSRYRLAEERINEGRLKDYTS